MATVPQELLSRTSAKPPAGGLLVLAVCLSAGCVTTKDFVPEAWQAEPPVYLVTRWHNAVVQAPDPTRGGQPAPGLLGRVYLFGRQIDCPLEGDGTLHFQLFDPCTPGPDGTPKPLETWNIDPATAARLKSKDAIGWGYSVFLPWATYSPERTKVLLRVCYKPKEGPPLYTDSGVVTLGGSVASPISAPIPEKMPLPVLGGFPANPMAPPRTSLPPAAPAVPAPAPAASFSIPITPFGHAAPSAPAARPAPVVAPAVPPGTPTLQLAPPQSSPPAVSPAAPALSISRLDQGMSPPAPAVPVSEAFPSVIEYPRRK